MRIKICELVQISIVRKIDTEPSLREFYSHLTEIIKFRKSIRRKKYFGQVRAVLMLREFRTNLPIVRISLRKNITHKRPSQV